MIGSVYASVYSSRLALGLPGGLPHGIESLAQSSAGAAFTVAGKLASGGHAALAAGVHDAAAQALVRGLSAGCLVAACVALSGAIAAALLLPAQSIAIDDDLADISMRPAAQMA